jgi:hypothetical protein
MPHPVIRPPRPRLGIIASLEQRWRDKLDELHAVAPGLPWGQPMTEDNLDFLEDLVAEKRRAKAPPPDDPLLVSARSDLRQLINEDRALVLFIKNAQGRVQLLVNDWRIKKLGLLKADCLTVPPGLGEWPEFHNASEVKQAERALLPRLQWLRSIKAQIDAVFAFLKLPAEEQSLELARADVARDEALLARVVNLEAQANALQARLDRLERKKKIRKAQHGHADH